MSLERNNAIQQRLLYWLSWAALAGAVLIVCSAGWLLWQAQVRMGMIYHGKTHMLPLAMRTQLAIPTILFALIPLAATAGCVAVQTRLPSRVVSTLFHLFVMMAGLGCFLVAREIAMASMLAQAFGGR